jgi:hypothetical protein
MSTHWKEPLDPTRHRDFMSGAEIGGRRRGDRRERIVLKRALSEFDQA